jgi:hypothetical protein
MFAWEKWEMATQVERISVLETKVDGLKEDVRVSFASLTDGSAVIDLKVIHIACWDMG